MLGKRDEAEARVEIVVLGVEKRRRAASALVAHLKRSLHESAKQSSASMRRRHTGEADGRRRAVDAVEHKGEFTDLDARDAGAVGLEITNHVPQRIRHGRSRRSESEHIGDEAGVGSSAGIVGQNVLAQIEDFATTLIAWVLHIMQSKGSACSTAAEVFTPERRGVFHGQVTRGRAAPRQGAADG